MRIVHTFSLFHWGKFFLGALFLAGCTTTSNHVVFKDKGIEIKHSEHTDYGLKLSGHGGSVLVINSAEVYGKKYPILAGEGNCVLLVPDHKLLLFVCAVARPSSGVHMDRELHVVNLDERSDTAIFLGQSHMGDDFGAHRADSKYAAKVEFESGERIRIVTYNGRTEKPPIYEPTKRSEFLVSLSQKKLLSTSNP